MTDNSASKSENENQQNRQDSWADIYLQMLQEQDADSDSSSMNLPDTGTDPLSMMQGDGGDATMSNYGQSADSFNASQAAPEVASTGELAEVAQLAVLL